LRAARVLSEDIVPYGIHHFDRREWVLKETGRGYRIWCSLDERAICRPILVNRYEEAETRFVEKLLQPGDIVVDAGANVGYFSLLCASLVGEGGRVEAFEPLPYLADALQASVDENGFRSRVRIYRLALADVAGNALIRHAPRTANFGGAHLALPSPLPEDHVDEAVRTVRLDDIFAGSKCRFLKLDVEGAEPRVIRGATRLLADARPVIMSELHNGQLRAVSGTNATAFISQMNALRYRCRSIDESGEPGAPIDRYDLSAPLNVIFEPTSA